MGLGAICLPMPPSGGGWGGWGGRLWWGLRVLWVDLGCSALCSTPPAATPRQAMLIPAFYVFLSFFYFSL